MWVLDSLGDSGLSREVTEHGLIDQNAVYLRLRELKQKGHLGADEIGDSFHWSLTERGQQALDDVDLPPADETNFEEHFAGRTMTLRPNLVLETVAREDDEWVPTSPSSRRSTSRKAPFGITFTTSRRMASSRRTTTTTRLCTFISGLLSVE